MKLIKVNFLFRVLLIVLLIIFSFFIFLFVFKSSALAGLRVCRDCDDCNCAASCGSGGASDWNYKGCGKDDCSSTETYRKRTVYTCSCGKYAICRVEEECVYSSSCVPACSNTSDCGHTCAANSCDACACDNDPRSSAYSWSSLGCSRDCSTCYCGKLISVVTHRECRGSSCVTVSGAGANLCNSNSDCATPTHRVCSGSSCVTVSGAGANLCNSNSDCGGGDGGCSIISAYNGACPRTYIIDSRGCCVCP